jgi:tetratricopeptide (TPR) repeat protein
MIVFALLTDKKTIRENAIWLKYLLIVLMLITAALFVFNSNGLYSVAERFSSIFNISEMDIASRLEGYKVAVKIIKENVILGSGMDSFSVKFRQYMPVSFRQYGGMLAHPGYAHNELLQTALDAGLLGLGIYLWLLIAFFNKTLKTIKTTAGQAKILLAGVLCSVAALLIQNQFSFNTITTAAYFWIFIGITVVISPVGEKTNLIKGKTLPQVMVYLIAIVIGAYSAPGIMKPVLADSFFTGADTCMKNGMPEEAVVLYTKAVKYNPGEAFYRMNLAKACKLISDGKVVLYEKKSYLNKAIVEYENQLNRQPYNALAWNGIGVCCFSLSKLENDTGLLGKSIDLLKRAIELDPNLVEACINLAFAYEKLEMYDDAVKSYNDVLRIDPQNDSAHFNLGCIYGNKKLFNKAVFHWQEALKSDPKNLKAKTYLEAVKYSVKQ